MSRADLDPLRVLLCRLEETVRDAAIRARDASSVEQMSAIAAVTSADTIYQIDKLTEPATFGWFVSNWPASEPVEIVMEGLEDNQSLSFPENLNIAATKWKCIIDPIDGTRGLMYDKRAAWSLAGLAPQRGPDTRLSDIEVAAMTEIPTSKQWRADQLSAVRGCGPQGVIAEAINVLDGSRKPFNPRPSRAIDFQNGFASLARFFPQGKAATAQLEEDLWVALHGDDPCAYSSIFDDQYISTGGQLHEIAVGHDRMLADLRPLVYRSLGLAQFLTCHPYDISTSLVLTELGASIEKPSGDPLDAPLDTTSPVSWVAYANDTLADRVRPVLQDLLERRCGPL